jgi:hypothetical protein
MAGFAYHSPNHLARERSGIERSVGQLLPYLAQKTKVNNSRKDKHLIKPQLGI